MRRHAFPLVTALLVAVLLLSGWKAARASAALVRAPGMVEKTGLATARNAPVRAPRGSPLAEIGTAERAIVFVYSPECQVSHANMANWTDLVAELRGGSAALYAVAPVQSPEADAYWGGLRRHVRVITGTPEQVHTAFDVGNTPATLLLQRGVVRGQVIGPLTAAAARQIRSFARTGTL